MFEDVFERMHINIWDILDDVEHFTNHYNFFEPVIGRTNRDGGLPALQDPPGVTKIHNQDPGGWSRWLRLLWRVKKANYSLLILSQVILSLQLPFAVIPLIHFTSDRSTMGEFANNKPAKFLAWIVATIIVGLNAKLIIDQIHDWVVSVSDQF